MSNVNHMEERKMADTAASRAKTDEKIFEGLNEVQKKFLVDLGDFLTNYEDFAGETPFVRSLGAKFGVQVANYGNSCRRFCWDAMHKQWFCCG